MPAWQVAGSVVLLLAISAIALREAKKRPYLIMGWLWFLGTLLPVIGLMRIGIGLAMADRYHYVPSIGLFTAIVFGLADLASAWRIGRAAIASVTAIVLLALGSLSWIQVRFWRDSITLFERTLSVTSNNALIQNQLGVVLNQQGKRAEAFRHFDEALRIKPDYFHALANMGLALSQQGKAAEAIDFYQRALKVRPDSAQARMQLGRLLADQGKQDEAVQEFVKAAPNDFDLRVRLGEMLARQGKHLGSNLAN